MRGNRRALFIRSPQAELINLRRRARSLTPPKSIASLCAWRTVCLLIAYRCWPREFRSACVSGLEKAIEAGDCLIEAKGLVPHGQWLPWLREHCGLSVRHAQRLMRLAKHRGMFNPKSDPGSHLSAKAALRFRTPPSPSPAPKASRLAPTPTALQIARAQEKAARAYAAARMFPAPTKGIPEGSRQPLIEDLCKLASSNPAERAEAAAAVERHRALLGVTWDQLIVPADEAAEVAQRQAA